MGRRHDNFGFTLLELVLVLAIVALALLAAAPTLRGFSRGRQASDTAAQFVATTQFTRSQAVSDGTTYRLNIDVQAGRWWVTMDNGSQFVQVESRYGQSFVVPEGVQIETDAATIDGTQVIEFDPTGRSDPTHVTFIPPGGGNPVVVLSETPMDLFHVEVGK